MALRARATIVARKIKKCHPWGRDFYLCSSILFQNYTETAPNRPGTAPWARLPHPAPPGGGRAVPRGSDPRRRVLYIIPRRWCPLPNLRTVPQRGRSCRVCANMTH